MTTNRTTVQLNTLYIPIDTNIYRNDIKKTITTYSLKLSIIIK